MEKSRKPREPEGSAAIIRREFFPGATRFALGILFSGVLIWLGLSIPANASELGEQLQTLLQTNITEIDLDGDGAIDEVRRFSPSGRLIYLESIDRRHRPERREVWSSTAGGSVQTRSVYVGGLLERRIVERYGRNETLVRKDVYWASGGPGSGLDHSTVMQFAGSKVFETRFELRGQAWTELARIERSGRHYMDTTGSDKKRWGSYYECRKNKGMSADEAAECARQAEKNDEAVFKQPLPDLAVVVPESCEDGSTRHLDNGIRIDRNSCGTSTAKPSPIDEIEAATKLTTGPLLQCLARFNPSYAHQFASNIRRRHPIIRCIGTKEGLAGANKSICGNPKSKCKGSYEEKDMGQFGAFVEEKRPNDVALVTVDPNYLNANPKAKGTTSQKDINNYLGAAIFHELLHSCGHDGYHDHGSMEGHIDDVFGCHAICMNETTQGSSDLSPLIAMSQENCLACMRAGPDSREDMDKKRMVNDGDKPKSAEETSLCGAYPPRGLVLKLEKAYFEHYRTDDCVAQIKRRIRKQLGKNTANAQIEAEYQKSARQHFDALASEGKDCKGGSCQSCAYLVVNKTDLGCGSSASFGSCLGAAKERFNQNYKATREAVTSNYPKVSGAWDKMEKRKAFDAEREEGASQFE